MTGVVRLLCRPGSQHFSDKKIDLKPGESLNLGRCSWWRYELQINGLFFAPVVSRKHAVLKFNGNSFSIFDEGSLNGSFLNEQRLSATGEESQNFALTCGDLLRLGSEGMDQNGKKMLPIICMLELDPCICNNHDSIVPSSVNIDKMQDDEDEVKKEEFPQTQSLLALEQEGLAEYEGEVGGR